MLKGLIVSIHDHSDRSAYSHRLHSLAACLSDRGISSDFLYMEDNPPLDISTSASVFFPLWINRVKQYDFIHGGDAEAAQALFFTRILLRRPVILDVHGDVNAQSALANEIRTSGRKRSPSLRVKLNYRMAVSCADHFLTVSRYQTEALIEQGIGESRISLVRNGVDLNLFAPSPYTRSTHFKFGYAGGFGHWQAIDLLVEAFALIDDPSARLLVVGFQEQDGPLKQRLRNRFGDRAELFDRTSQVGLVEILRSVSVFVIPRIEHPAIRHAFPTKFAEYAALGRPIMVNDVDETAEFVRKYRCGFVSSPSAEGMARTMTEALKTRVETLREMGNRARTMAEENFAWSAIGDSYVQAVHAVVERFRPPSELD